jgi:hypothetical protein
VKGSYLDSLVGWVEGIKSSLFGLPGIIGMWKITDCFDTETQIVQIIS